MINVDQPSKTRRLFLNDITNTVIGLGGIFFDSLRPDYDQAIYMGMVFAISSSLLLLVYSNFKFY